VPPVPDHLVTQLLPRNRGDGAYCDPEDSECNLSGGRHEKNRRNSRLRRCYPIITQLRDQRRKTREFPGKLMNQNQRHTRGYSLESIDNQIAKVEVAGSNPVSRFFSSTIWRLPSEVVPRLYRVKESIHESRQSFDGF